MKLSVLIKVLITLVFVAYPFIVYVGIQTVPPSFIGVLLMVLLAMRFGVLRAEERRLQLPILLVFLVYALIATLLRSEKFLLFYPVMVNLVLFAVFVSSLRDKESILLRLVRARGVKISVYGPSYLNRLTAVWAGFFLLNAAVAAWTTTQPLATWTLYNGLIAYLLVAIMMAIEWLFRIQYKKHRGI